MTTNISDKPEVARAKQVIRELRRSRDSLASFAEGLSEQDLARQSACAD